MLLLSNYTRNIIPMIFAKSRLYQEKMQTSFSLFTRSNLKPQSCSTLLVTSGTQSALSQNASLYFKVSRVYIGYFKFLILHKEGEVW
jgi:hypothetical protein